MKAIFYVCIVAMISGCAGSPMQVTSMNSTEIKSVSNVDLCKTYSFKGYYDGDTYTVRNEVKRRGLECGIPGSLKPDITPANDAALLQGLSIMANSGNSVRNSSLNKPKAFLQSEYTKGFNKVCIYDRLGSVDTLVIGATQICPLTN